MNMARTPDVTFDIFGLITHVDHDNAIFGQPCGQILGTPFRQLIGFATDHLW